MSSTLRVIPEISVKQPSPVRPSHQQRSHVLHQTSLFSQLPTFQQSAFDEILVELAHHLRPQGVPVRRGLDCPNCVPTSENTPYSTIYLLHSLLLHLYMILTRRKYFMQFLK